MYGQEARPLVETACGAEGQSVVEHPVLFTARCDEVPTKSNPPLVAILYSSNVLDAIVYSSRMSS